MLTFLLSASIVFFSHSMATAQDSIVQKNTCEKRYVISFQDDAPGFFVDKDNKKNGTAYELLLEIIRRLGCKSTEQVNSYLAARENMARNKTDIYALGTPDEKFEKTSEFVEMYRIPRSLVISKKVADKNSTIETILNNPNVLFGNVIEGRLFIKESEQTDLRLKHRLRDFPGPALVFKALLDGRIQATFSSPAFTYYFLTRENRMENFVSIPDGDGEAIISGFYLSRKRLSEQERASIKKIIKEIRQDGTLALVAKKYVNPVDLKYYQPENQ
ncbi:transporter substrate-binding domain-containing protein [Bdellovibrio sp. HCB290]|uniref:transporter substrate-binding domain-containing protein n=1 Tax=Bdellovibrio sp. HCB290 TaxID=3394356 RepID=UPI0039B5C67B